MAEVDEDARETAWKALTISFIILIVLTNVGLIFRIVRRHMPNFMFLCDAKRLTIISMAIGDIFLALFTLVVRARRLFEDDFISCRTNFISRQVYGYFLLNFVYGVGLVILAVELFIRLKRPISESSSAGLSKIQAVIVSAAPWILGLIIILPLSMANIGLNWDTCRFKNYNPTREKTTIGVSICLPASLALLAGILMMCVKQSACNYTLSSAAAPVSQIPLQNRNTYDNFDSNLNTYDNFDSNLNTYDNFDSNLNTYDNCDSNLNTYNNCDSSTKHTQGGPVFVVQCNPLQHPQVSNPSPPPPYHAYDNFPVYQYANNQPSDTPQYCVSSSQSFNYPQHSVYMPETSNYPQHSVSVSEPPNSQLPPTTNSVKEKVTLLLVCIVNYMCVLPMAVFSIEYLLNEDKESFDLDHLTEVVLSDLFYWLMICRSVLAPLIWICRLGH